MKAYDDNVLKEENTILHEARVKNGDSIPKLVASMPGDQARGEWELHTLKNMG